MKCTERINLNNTGLYSEVSVTDSDSVFIAFDWYGAGSTLLGAVELHATGDRDQALKFLGKLERQVQATIQSLLGNEDDDGA